MTTSSTDILLVGKTGTGKSATGNSIVGYRAFKSKSSFDSVTTQVQFGHTEFEGRVLKVVDGPGIGDTRFDNEESVKRAVEAIAFAVTANPVGYHAILMVVRYGGRFTKEDTDTVLILKNIFGEDFIKYHAIVLVTCGDNFEMDGENAIFEDWVRRQGGYFRQLIDECGNRIIMFDNATRDKNIKIEQNRKLLKMIDRLAGNGVRYTSDIFYKAKDTRDRLLREYRIPQLKEEAIMKCGLITQQLAQIDYENPEYAIRLLESLKKRAEALEQDIIKQTRGFHSMRVAIILAQQLNDSVIAQMKAAKEVLKIQQEMNEMELELKMERTRLEEQKKKREYDNKRREDTKRENMQETDVQLELQKQRKVIEKLVEQQEEKKQREMHKITENYENVRNEQSLGFVDVVKYLAKAALKLIKWALF